MFVGWLVASLPGMHAKSISGTEGAQSFARATELERKLLVKLVISSIHCGLTPGKPVLALAL